MNPYITEANEDFNKALQFFKDEIAKVRAGVANPALIEHVQVEAYGAMTPLPQVASITISDPKTMVVAPWDKSIIKDIEKAIVNSGQNINPVNEGDQIRIVIPPLTEESRKELMKIVKDKAEHTRNAVRGLRDKVKERIINEQKESNITEDERYKYLKELDEFTSKINKEIKDVAQHKEEAIMKV